MQIFLNSYTEENKNCFINKRQTRCVDVTTKSLWWLMTGIVEQECLKWYENKSVFKNNHPEPGLPFFQKMGSFSKLKAVGLIKSYDHV
jgi:hypothetical protein